MTVNSDQNIDRLRQIYGEMNETGKEKLKEVSDQILKIWKTVNDKNVKFENEGNR
jgi:hypothetical protein